jgi:hypothetical protein
MSIEAKKEAFQALRQRKDRTIIHLIAFIKEQFPQVWKNFTRLAPIDQTGKTLVKMVEEA